MPRRVKYIYNHSGVVILDLDGSWRIPNIGEHVIIKEIPFIVKNISTEYSNEGDKLISNVRLYLDSALD